MSKTFDTNQPEFDVFLSEGIIDQYLSYHGITTENTSLNSLKVWTDRIEKIGQHFMPADKAQRQQPACELCLFAPIPLYGVEEGGSQIGILPCYNCIQARGES